MCQRQETYPVSDIEYVKKASDASYLVLHMDSTKLQAESKSMNKGSAWQTLTVCQYFRFEANNHLLVLSYQQRTFIEGPM